MNVNGINRALIAGNLDQPSVLPHLQELARSPLQFQVEFGLPQLPTEPGIILLRGARQYGKSTWLEQQLRATVVDHGPGSALYINGDELRDAQELAELVRALAGLYSPTAHVRRLFVDEVTAVKNWEQAIKRLVDGGELRDVLVVTTGSKATDLRRGAERLPGRKGKLARTTYYFAPISFQEFKRVCGERLGPATVHAYVLSGGCPVACTALATNGVLPEHVIEMIRDWIYGECSSAGRDRASLLGVLENLIRCGGTACGQAKIAREAGLANNTVAAGYLELLLDLMCLAASYAWDEGRRVSVRRRPCKYHFVNLLAASAFYPGRLRTVADFEALPREKQGVWYEWAVAQELWRRAVIRGDEFPQLMNHWSTKEREIDFVTPSKLVEVKRGPASPLEFTWAAQTFPKSSLTVVNEQRFDSRVAKGITLEDFLLAD